MREEGWRPWRRGVPGRLPGLEPVIGHRGATARAPENTLAGLRKAHALGARWVEFDVMLTADQVPVLIHDETLERTTSGRGEVAAHTAAQIATLDAGAWFGPDFAGEPVPTLAEAVALLLDLGMAANVEIKPATGHEEATGRVVAEHLARLWPADGPRLLVSSFARSALATAAEVAGHVPRGLLAEDLPADWEAALTALGCTTLHLDHARVDAPTIRDLAAGAVPVLLYTVNDPARARTLREAGAAAVITDVPDLLLAAQ
ncbi:MAG: glycerophosphodiester phosphodiesterase [Geminicoccaceae bacterium]